MPVTRRIVVLVAALCLAFAPSAASAGVSATAAPDGYDVNEGQTLTVAAPGVLANDAGDGPLCVAAVNVTNLEGHLGDQDDEGWSADGSFTFTSWEWWNGQTSFTYDLGTLSGADCVGPALTTGTVTIDVASVNDPPTAVVAGSCTDGVVVEQDSAPYEDPSHCVENHNWGPVDEVTQYLSEWLVTTDRPELFSAVPSISVAEHAFGELHFTPVPGAHGAAKVSVRARDDGGTARGGDDLSPPVTFTIRITATPEPTPEPPIATEIPSVAPSPPPSVSPSAPASAEPTSAPEGSPASAPIGDSPVLLAGLLVAAVLLAAIAASRLLRRARTAP